MAILKHIASKSSSYGAALEYLLDISGRTPYWICRQLFCDAVFSNYLETAKDVGTTPVSYTHL